MTATFAPAPSADADRGGTVAETDWEAGVAVKTSIRSGPGGLNRLDGQPRTALVLSWAALLGFFGRSIIDFRYVYPEQIPGVAATAVALVVHVAFLGGWIAALIALAGGHRWGGIACLGFALLPILLGATTATVFCPTPCETAAPLADIANWVCLALGILSAVSLVVFLRRSRTSGSAVGAGSEGS